MSARVRVYALPTPSHFGMPDKDDHESQEQQRRWAKLRTTAVTFFSGAKRIFLEKPEINAVGQNATITRQNFTSNRDQIIIFAEPNATYVERPEARG